MVWALSVGSFAGYGQAEPAKPAVGEVQMYLLTQPTLRTDAEAVTNDQHADHQFWINGGPPDLAVERA